jgi:two-component system NtrC family sensor kinase
VSTGPTEPLSTEPPSADGADATSSPSGRAPQSVSVAPETQNRAPAEWLDRLLHASNALFTDHGPLEVATALLEAVSPSLEGRAIGVCTPDTKGRSSVVRVGGSVLELDHPARVFPSWDAEEVFPIPLDEGTTLHVASPTGMEPAPPQLVARLVATLGASLRRARVLDGERQADEVRTKLEAKMIDAERLAGLGQIAAGILHDLNTPLTTVVAYADYLRKRWANAPNVDDSDKQRLIRMHEAAERLLSFSRDLMAYSRPQTHVPAPVDVVDVVERSLSFCEHVITTGSVVVERDFHDVRPVRGVSGQLVQVFVNLITNACQAVASGPGSRVRLSARAGDVRGTVVVVIADDGVGLPIARERLFEPFFTTKEGGTGLGLAIVRKIVEAHGGTVCAEEAKPRGTAFVVTLPVAASGSDPAL